MVNDKQAILIIEDDRDHFDVLSTHLEQAGYEVLPPVKELDNLSQLFYKKNITCVLIDVRLNDGRDGIEIIESLQKRILAPVIFMSGYCSHEMIERAKLTAPYGFLIKPFNVEELLFSVWLAISKYKVDQKYISINREQDLILENALMGIVLIKNNKIVRLNTLMQEISGYSRNELLDGEITMLFPRNSESRTLAKDIRLSFQEDRSFTEEMLIERKDGTRSWCSVHGKPLSNEVDESVEVWIFRDISEEKLLNIRIKENESRFRSIYNNSPVMMCTVNDHGRISDVNDKWLEKTGYERDEVIGLYLSEVILDDYNRKNKTISGKISANAKVRNLIASIIRKDNSSLKVILDSNQNKDSNDTLSNIIVFTDISEKIAAEKALSDSVNRYQHLVEASPYAIFLHTNGVIAYVNKAGIDLLGIESISDLVGMNLSQYLPEMASDKLRNSIDAGPQVTHLMSEVDKEVSVELTQFSYDKKNDGKFLVFLRDLTEQNKTEEQARFLAYFDNLTGLPNRRLFFDRLSTQIDMAAQNNELFSLIMINVNKFSQINDYYGHDVGDLFLIEVSDRLRQFMLKGDSIANLGKDEFAMILPGVHDRAQINKVVNKLFKVFQKPIEVEGNTIEKTISVGIASYPRDGRNDVEILQNCDVALKKAQQEAGNSFSLYDSSMNDELNHLVNTEQDMRFAFNQNQFALYYQAKYDSSGNIVGAEALVRWISSEKGVIAPADFIPIAEESRFIVPLGYWVLEEAIRQNKAWQENGLEAITLSVNLSPLQLKEKNIEKNILDSLERHGLNAKYLELEITESAAMEHNGSNFSLLEKLKSMGIRIAIDDFGTGYSSLSKLTQFPVDVLKIDKSFIDDIPEKNDANTVAQLIINLAKSLNIMVIAEGVERKEQYDFLRKQGCSQLQGFYFSQPMPGEDFEELLLREKSRKLNEK